MGNASWGAGYHAGRDVGHDEGVSDGFLYWAATGVAAMVAAYGVSRYLQWRNSREGAAAVAGNTTDAMTIENEIQRPEHE